MTDIHNATLGDGRRIRVRLGKHIEDTGEVDEFVTYHRTFSDVMAKVKEHYAAGENIFLRKLESPPSSKIPSLFELDTHEGNARKRQGSDPHPREITYLTLVREGLTEEEARQFSRNYN
ncbi:MAG: hypothetical protein GY833_22230 [Aestuariibacter sp.]|nr:hypothetical protein [Aestuariibacter sp.]